jgi:Ca2+-binding EF-hand superfamily protein
MSEEQFVEYEQAFALFDRDGDGCISAVELATLMRSVGAAPTQMQVDRFVAQVDGDRRTGLIKFDEFIAFLEDLRATPDTDDEVIAAFKYLDKDNTGYVPATELRRILTSIGDLLTHEEVDEMFREAKVEGNLISFDEYLYMFRK